ncbi:MAG: hypothetical protein ABIO78_04640 [Thermoanaerobaculia bacterium]
MIHIHNGDVVAVRARRVGVPGEHLAFRESMIGGPVRPNDPDWLAKRAAFLVEQSGDDMLRITNRLFEQDQTITHAAATQDEIVLWFEHDLFCLIHFIYLLQRLPPGKTSIIWNDLPLGELEPEELARMHTERRAGSREMARVAGEVWQAYTSPDPTVLNAMLSAHAEFPFLQDGLALHVTRFPSVRNGLGLAEQRILEAIADGATDFQALLSRFWSSHRRYGFGDAEVMREVRRLSGRRIPLVSLMQADKKMSFAVTDQGERTLAGLDDIAENGIDLWLGGAHLTKEQLWRWDPQRGAIVASP